MHIQRKAPRRIVNLRLAEPHQTDDPSLPLPVDRYDFDSAPRYEIAAWQDLMFYNHIYGDAEPDDNDDQYDNSIDECVHWFDLRVMDDNEEWY